MKRLSMLLMLVCGMASAQTTIVTPPLQDGLYVLRVKNQQAILTPAVEPNVPVNPVVPTPTPIPTPTPTTDLSQVASSAIAGVPEYAGKDTQIRQLAFLVNFVAPNIPSDNTPPAADSILALKKTFLIATGTDDPQWAGFWTAVEPHLKACSTNAQFSAAVKVIQQELANSLPDSSDEEPELFGSFPTYGAKSAMDGKLGDGTFLAWLMANLPQIIAIIKMFVPQIPNIPLPF